MRERRARGPGIPGYRWLHPSLSTEAEVMKPAALALALLLSLGGCTGGLTERVKPRVQAATDEAADAIFASVCAATLGAVGRRESVHEQYAALMICWPELYEALGSPAPPAGRVQRREPGVVVDAE